MSGFEFREMMDGTLRMNGDERPFRFDFEVRGPSRWFIWFHWLGAMTGTATIDGFVTESPAQGELETAPVRGWMRYAFSFKGPGGESLSFAGRKRIRFLFVGWTTLRGNMLDASGNEIGTAVLHFRRENFKPFVRSMRSIPRSKSAARA